MKLSEITAGQVAGYLRLESGEYDETLLSAIMASARQYIASYTGIPETAENGGETLDNHEDFCIAFLVLCQDMYDNRTMYPDIRYAASANRVVESILGLHARNLL